MSSIKPNDCDSPMDSAEEVASGLVADDAFGLDAGQQLIGALQVGRLAGREMHSRRVAERIHGGMDLGA